MLELVQRSVSEGAGVERIMDWVEARLEAVRRDEEEEEEGEDSQRRATQSQVRFYFECEEDEWC